MTNFRADHSNVQSIALPEGTLHFWGWDYDSKHKRDDIVYLEIDEDEGGFLVPSGRTIYSHNKSKNRFVKAWSMHSGFLGHHYTLIDFGYHPEGKKTNRQLRFNDPDIEFLSDVIFNLLINDLLPINKINIQYHLDRKDAIAEFYAKTRKIDALNDELYLLGAAEAAIADSQGTSDAIFGGYMPRLKLEAS